VIGMLTLFAVGETDLIVAFVVSTATILAVLLPLLISTRSHAREAKRQARGAYDAVNRVDAVIEPGMPGTPTDLNLRQIVEAGFQRNDDAHEYLRAGIDGNLERIAKLDGRLQSHIEEPFAHHHRHDQDHDNRRDQ
jgi:hypothetical protein